MCDSPASSFDFVASVDAMLDTFRRFESVAATVAIRTGADPRQATAATQALHRPAHGGNRHIVRAVDGLRSAVDSLNMDRPTLLRW